jgi:hypothetical protein
MASFVMPFGSKAQDEDRKLYLSNRFMIKATPTSILDRAAAHIPIGAEFLFDDEYGISLEVGIPLLRVYERWGRENDVKFHSDWRIRVDGRYYFANGRHLRVFMGGEGFWRKLKFSDEYGYYRTGYKSATTYQSAKGTRVELGGAYFMGLMVKCTQRIFIEGRVGVGVKTVMASYYDVNGTGGGTVAPAYIGTFYSRDMTWSGFALDTYTSTGIKIGFLLGT